LLHISGISPIGLVGGDAYIAPAKYTPFYGNLRRIRNFPWADAGIDPYADLEDPAKNKR